MCSANVHRMTRCMYGPLHSCWAVEVLGQTDRLVNRIVVQCQVDQTSKDRRPGSESMLECVIVNKLIWPGFFKARYRLTILD